MQTIDNIDQLHDISEVHKRITMSISNNYSKSHIARRGTKSGLRGITQFTMANLAISIPLQIINIHFMPLFNF